MTVSKFTVCLEGGAPWGFRLKGGHLVGEVIKIGTLNPNGKASRCGVKIGDELVGIQSKPVGGILSHRDCTTMINEAKDRLILELKRNADMMNGSIRPASSLGTTSSSVDGRLISDISHGRGRGRSGAGGGVVVLNSPDLRNWTGSGVPNYIESEEEEDIPPVPVVLSSSSSYVSPPNAALNRPEKAPTSPVSTYKNSVFANLNHHHVPPDVASLSPSSSGTSSKISSPPPSIYTPRIQPAQRVNSPPAPRAIQATSGVGGVSNHIPTPPVLPQSSAVRPRHLARPYTRKAVSPPVQKTAQNIPLQISQSAPSMRPSRPRNATSPPASFGSTTPSGKISRSMGPNRAAAYRDFIEPVFQSSHREKASAILKGSKLCFDTPWGPSPMLVKRHIPSLEDGSRDMVTSPGISGRDSVTIETPVQRNLWPEPLPEVDNRPSSALPTTLDSPPSHSSGYGESGGRGRGGGGGGTRTLQEVKRNHPPTSTSAYGRSPHSAPAAPQEQNSEVDHTPGKSAGGLIKDFEARQKQIEKDFRQAAPDVSGAPLSSKPASAYYPVTLAGGASASSNSTFSLEPQQSHHHQASFNAPPAPPLPPPSHIVSSTSSAQFTSSSSSSHTPRKLNYPNMAATTNSFIDEQPTSQSYTASPSLNFRSDHQFISSDSHQCGTPVSVSKAGIKLKKNQPPPPPTHNEYIDSDSGIDGPPMQQPQQHQQHQQTRLPKSQSPTVTLLQKNREGQLPRGAVYLGQNDVVEDGMTHTDKLYLVRESSPSRGGGSGQQQPIPRQVTQKNISSEKSKEWYKDIYKEIHGVPGPPRPHVAPQSVVPPPPPPHQQPISVVHDPQRLFSDEEGMPDFRAMARANQTLPNTYEPTYQWDNIVDGAPPGRGRPEGRAAPPGGTGGNFRSDSVSSSTSRDESPAQRQQHQLRNFRADSPNYRSDVRSPTATKPRSSSSHKQFPQQQQQPGRIEDYQPGRPPSYLHHEYQAEEEVPISIHHQNSFLSDTIGGQRDSRQIYREVQKGADIPISGFRKPIVHQQDGYKYLTSVDRNYAAAAAVNGGPSHNTTAQRWDQDVITDRESRDLYDWKRKERLERLAEHERRRRAEMERIENEARRHGDHFLPSEKQLIPTEYRIDRSPPREAVGAGAGRPRPASAAAAPTATITNSPSSVIPNRSDDLSRRGGGGGDGIRPRGVRDIRGKCRALYSFKAENSKELSFRKNDVIYLLRQIDENWYEGQHHGRIGIFPVNYVEIIRSLDEARQLFSRSDGLAQVKFDFIAQSSIEVTLKKGESVDLIRTVDSNWFEGRSRSSGKQGIFPKSYVEVVQEPGTPLLTPAPSLVSTPIPGSPASVLSPANSVTNIGPPRPTTQPVYRQHSTVSSVGSHNIRIETKSPFIAENRVSSPVVKIDEISSKERPDSRLRMEYLPTSSPVYAGRISPGPAALVPPASGAPGPSDFNSQEYDDWQGYRHFRAASMGRYGPPAPPLTALHGPPPPSAGAAMNQEVYRAVYRYLPQNADELELQEGDIVRVLEKCDDGWFVGTHEMSGNFGTFPGNYVQRVL